VLLLRGHLREARKELERANRLKPEMPETLYALVGEASLEGDHPAAEKAWARLLAIEKEGALAAQAYFGLAGLHRKQGRIADSDRETGELKVQQFARQSKVIHRQSEPRLVDSLPDNLNLLRTLVRLVRLILCE
jgi:tetratricopeptide (TPR) repeat protein